MLQRKRKIEKWSSIVEENLRYILCLSTKNLMTKFD